MKTFKEPLAVLFERDLKAAIVQVSSYENEADLWKVDKEIKNSGGNLALHISGNLRHFLGHVMGGTDYIRDRSAEFSAKNIPASDIVQELEAAIEQIYMLIVIRTSCQTNDQEAKAEHDAYVNNVMPVVKSACSAAARAWSPAFPA